MRLILHLKTMDNTTYYEHIEGKGVTAVIGRSPTVLLVEVIKMANGAVEIKRSQQTRFFSKSFRECTEEVFLYELRKALTDIDKLFPVYCDLSDCQITIGYDWASQSSESVKVLVRDGEVVEIIQ